MDLPVPLQTWLPGSPPHGGVQSEAGAGIQCFCYRDCAHRALQGCALLSQTHQGKSHSTLVYLLALLQSLAHADFIKKQVSADLEIDYGWRLSGVTGLLPVKWYSVGATWWEMVQNVLTLMGKHKACWSPSVTYRALSSINSWTIKRFIIFFVISPLRIILNQTFTVWLKFRLSAFYLRGLAKIFY